MRLYSWFLRELYSYAGDSNISLGLCMLAWSGADASFAGTLTPPIKKDDCPALSLVLWILYTIIISASMRYFGPLDTVDGLVYFFVIRQCFYATAKFQEMTIKCRQPSVASRLRRDYTFAVETLEEMAMPFACLGGAVGAFLQMFLPLKYTSSGIVLLAACKLIIKLGSR